MKRLRNSARLITTDFRISGALASVACGLCRFVGCVIVIYRTRIAWFVLTVYSGSQNGSRSAFIWVFKWMNTGELQSYSVNTRVWTPTKRRACRISLGIPPHVYQPVWGKSMVYDQQLTQSANRRRLRTLPRAADRKSHQIGASLTLGLKRISGSGTFMVFDFPIRGCHRRTKDENNPPRGGKSVIQTAISAENIHLCLVFL